MSDSPPLWSRHKYLSAYWIDYCRFYTDIHGPMRMNLSDTGDYLFNTASRPKQKVSKQKVSLVPIY